MGIPCSSRVRATTTPPYFFARGNTAAMLSLLPLTELIMALPGYAACSCLPLPSLLLTSDWGIMRALKPVTDAVCWIPAEGILLPGYNEGFLGGASGVLTGEEGTEVFFFGDPSSMEYAETLSRMLDASGADFHLLAEDHPLTDRGGIRFIRRGTR